MSTNTNSPSGPALLANEPHLQDVTLPVVDEGDRAVVSPQSNIDCDTALIHRENRMVRGEIVVYKDMPGLRAEATARLRKYYTELEFLNSSL